MLRKTWLPAVALAAGLVMGASTAALTEEKGAKPEGRGKYPHIHAAARALQHAENQLEKAEHHFGGHRAKALELAKQAEQELKEAVAWADAHPEEFRKGADKKTSEKK
ncbi:MAG: hypothetical protein AUH29_15805 [Candidatus Rokubacteria bacterium 13_1_40CM_69_27]|nr:MAG: hypothetical protein AUH29_15805 [Candidatus Rokubacteria bacterium 13_1_40CM_69_27]